MAKRAAKKTAVAYIDATLQEIRLFSERAQILDVSAAEGRVSATVATNANLGVAILDDKDGKRRLLISQVYKVDVASQGSATRLAEYESDYRAIFAIRSMTGVELDKPIPIPVAEPYIAQLNWAARARARGTFLAMGMNGVNLPPLPVHEEKP